MKCLYPVHPELVKDAAGDTSKFAMTPRMIHLCAKIAHFSRRFVKVPQDMRKQNIQITSYDGKAFDTVLYTPVGIEKPAPCLVYYPGGGFVVGAYPYMHTIAMKYAKEAGCKVLFVNYRLANDPCFTATIEDAYAAVQYVWKKAEELDVDREHIAVAGDSAGGSLAAIVSIMARDRKALKICYQMMIYPTTKMDAQTWSRQNFNNTPGINSEWAKVFLAEALKNGSPEKKEYMSPLDLEDFAGLPPAYLETEEFCPLRDEGNLYAQKLIKHGIPVVHNQMKGTFHAYDSNLKPHMVQEILHKRANILKCAFHDNFSKLVL